MQTRKEVEEKETFRSEKSPDTVGLRVISDVSMAADTGVRLLKELQAKDV